MATSETRNCQNCKQGFVIEPDDFAFYEKIKVPPPTWCPECRAIRRMMWRNERSLYKRRDAFGKDVVSDFAPDLPRVVYERSRWWADDWDPLEFGLSVDFSIPSFAQYMDLLARTPMPSLFANTVDKTEYGNHIGHMKRCYLVFAAWECEDVLYSAKIIRAKNIVDGYLTNDSEFCYETVDCTGSHGLRYARDSHQCTDSAFLYDCRNCQDCFGCAGLRNKKYYIFNTPYSKEEYERIVEEYNVGGFVSRNKFRTEAEKLWASHPRKYAVLTNTVNVQGDHCQNMKDCVQCFDLTGPVENSKHMIMGGLGLTDSYDGYGVGAGCDMLYEGVDAGVDGGSKERFSVVVYGCRDTHYCYNCENSSNLFGCIGLRNKQYCILNKQYTKEEYEALVPRIIQHMNDMPYADKQGRIYRYGEFFPPELSPFAYNETIAQEYFPLTKEEAQKQGYRWRDPDTKQYVVTKKPDDLPDHIKDTDDSILKETIGCMHKGECNEQCTTAFRIIPEELSFYRRMNVPLPRLCPNCRHYERLKQRNPLKLWHRRCMCSGQSANGKEQITYQNTAKHFHDDNPCPNEFETSYAPERKEIVYCEACYNSEVA